MLAPAMAQSYHFESTQHSHRHAEGYDYKNAQDFLRSQLHDINFALDEQDR